MAGDWCEKERRPRTSGKQPGTGTARPAGNRSGRNCVGGRSSTGTYGTQATRPTEQQKEQELGGRREQGQQETEVLRLLYTNAQSILGKLNELSAITTDTKPDFILLTETWCNPSITTADLTLPGYQLEQDLRRDREDTANGIGGGLLVYSRNGHKILPSELVNEEHYLIHTYLRLYNLSVIFNPNRKLVVVTLTISVASQ